MDIKSFISAGRAPVIVVKKDELEGLNADVCFRRMTVRERNDLKDRHIGTEELEKNFDYIAWAKDTIASAVCDLEGNRLDREALINSMVDFDQVALESLFDYAQKLNKFGKYGKNAVKDAEKNSQSNQSEDSSST